MHFNADIASDGNAHQRQLHVASRPKCCAEIRVHFRGVVYIEYHRFASIVPNFGMWAIVSVIAHNGTSFQGLGTVYAQLSQTVNRQDTVRVYPLPHDKYRGKWLLNHDSLVLSVLFQAISRHGRFEKDFHPLLARP